MQTKYDELARLAEAAETNRYWSEDNGTLRYGLAPSALEDFAKAANPEIIQRLVRDLRNMEAERNELDADLVKAQSDRDALAEALRPFVTHNSSEPTIDLRVFTSDITKARAALARVKDTP